MDTNPDALLLESLADLERIYQENRTLFEAQPAIVQRFLEAQAASLAQAFVDRAKQVHFTLPDRVLCEAGGGATPQPIPEAIRSQRLGSLKDRLFGRDVRTALKEHLLELENAGDQAVAVGARLLRFATAQYMVYRMLPSGRNVTYLAAEDDEIPSIPQKRADEVESAIMAATDAVTVEEAEEVGRGSLQIPYVPAARRFYLPQWVAFDEDGKLLVGSPAEAEAHIASMQRFLEVLFAARSLAPYIVVDEEFKKKHYGMLGQLVNQGRALARYKVEMVIETIRRRAAAHTLDRGLTLNLPYFDDQDLELKSYRFIVIPAGRIMFAPAFVVRAAREEQVKVAQDTRFNTSTRRHLLESLKTLEEAFVHTGGQLSKPD